MTDRGTRPVRIANCSGFYGDHLAAARELLDGPDTFDVLTGDYLAELTMLILWKLRRRDPAAGYVPTFEVQMADVLGDCLDRGIKVVANAGGLNPHGLKACLEAIGSVLPRPPRIAVVEGDDLAGRLADLAASGTELRNLDTGATLGTKVDAVATANAYLGGFGIAAALEAGADVVITGRVTDASLVVGPAAWWHGWSALDLDELAGAVVAGHVIECGTQTTGGNYPFLDELAPGYPGFPICEVAADGSCVVTKQPGTGGAVTVGTVTAQLLYELGAPRYENPDAAARFDTVTVEQMGPDRVGVAGTKGESPPSTLKVALNFDAGYRNTMTLVLTGLDLERKAAHAESLLFGLLGGREQFEEVDVQLIRTDHDDAPSNAQATALLRVTVKDPDRERVGRRFSNAVTELALASYAGFFTTTPPTDASAYGVYWPLLVPRELVTHSVVLPSGERLDIPHAVVPPTTVADVTSRRGADTGGPTTRRPLGDVCGARSGDKGGNANVGLWTMTDEAYDWLAATLTVERFKALVAEAADLEVRRYELANLRALNFVVVGILGEGVASTTRFDPQAKGLGEYLRSRTLDVPDVLVAPR
ncbi:MAG TPA: acyclic terpene utilization AtuA family protein [Acidimicrobiales bacterium]